MSVAASALRALPSDSTAMKQHLILALLGLSMSLPAENIPADATPEQIATTPVPRNEHQWWRDRHAERVEMTKSGGLEVVFIGDSITQGWEGAGKDQWEKRLAPLKAGNFGFSGDRTEHVLWRLDNGEIVGLTPKVAVIMIGTNNLGHAAARQTPESTAKGVEKIVQKLREKLPDTQILLLGIFPRSEQPSDPLRVKVRETNELLKKMAQDQPKVRFVDIGEKFLQEDGILSKEVMPDMLHLSPRGYEIWADAVEPLITEVVK